MLTNLNIVLLFLEKCESKILIKRKRGKPQKFSNASMIIFFVQMMLQKIYTFQGMSKYATAHYVSYGWEEPPSRKTIRRRFLSLPAVLQVFMPQIAKECDVLNHKIFGFSWAFVDKSIFRAMGGIWHKAHIKLGVIPHSSIDSDASWGYSRIGGPTLSQMAFWLWITSHGKSTQIPNRGCCYYCQNQRLQLGRNSYQTIT